MSTTAVEEILILNTGVQTWSCFAAVCALYMYDRVITFGDDVELVWRRKWTGVTALYGLLHACVVAFLMVVLAGYFVVSCKSNYMLYISLYALDSAVLLLIGVTSIFRVYAINLRRDWRLPMAVFALVLAPVVQNSFFSAHVVVAPAPSPVNCIVYFDISTVGQNIATIVVRLSLIISDVLVLVVTWRETYWLRRWDTKPKDHYHSLTGLIFINGTVYFVSLFGLNLLAMILWLKGVFLFANFFVDVFMAILLSRFFLSLRHVHLASGQGELTDTASQVSEPRFASRIIGNLGAELEYGVQDDFTEDFDTLNGIADTLQTQVSNCPSIER
ncbi:uncharacterized protein B0H18DRAFT_1076014 [Fomitopsis serialis]|uniref:uncharacterized protein n=1 Tax=Fomitopsis serialis TaxID=139415 RepID=UPI0020078D55|nr:uncharacterized protein B0H18DRAFT_1076014 [Neoantrodia serialis]KAH9908234.1 hypothetical protein B0H18DRAFT_1076014 [Neoantrodia serialis]